MTGEAASAGAEAAAALPAELRKSVRDWYSLGFRASTGHLGTRCQRASGDCCARFFWWRERCLATKTHVPTYSQCCISYGDSVSSGDPSLAIAGFFVFVCLALKKFLFVFSNFSKSPNKHCCFIPQLPPFHLFLLSARPLRVFRFASLI